MLQYKIVKNEKSVTLLIKGARIFSATYLLERYNEERYFGNAKIKASGKTELAPFLQVLTNNVNEVSGTNLSYAKFFEGAQNPYPFVKRSRDKDDKIIEDNFELALGSFAKKEGHVFFYDNIVNNNPITNEDIIKAHEWDLEFEISARTGEDGVVKIFNVFHRAFKGASVEGVSKPNNSAWEGFNMSTPDTNFDVEEEDVPF